MSRISTEFLAAAPQARKALEQAQRLKGMGDQMQAKRPDLFGSRVNPRWMTDRNLPSGVRASIVMAESAGHLIGGLTDPDLRLLVIPAGQIRELPEMAPADVWREVRAGDRSPFPLMWWETPNMGITLHTQGGNWPSTGTPEKDFALLGFLVRDEPDALHFQSVMLEDKAGDTRQVDQHTRAWGYDLFTGVTFVIPRDDSAYSGAFLDGATCVARNLGDNDSGFIMETCEAFWQRVDGGVVADAENAGILSVTEGWVAVIGGVLQLLSSVNVEQRPVTQDPGVERHVRRAVKRGALEPSYIYIRQRRVRSDSERGGVSGRKLTVRSEVRGHFKHYTEAKDSLIWRSAPPEKRRFNPELGWHVRYWTRPHVRGPEDAPLRISPRKLGEHAPASDAPLTITPLAGSEPPRFVTEPQRPTIEDEEAA